MRQRLGIATCLALSLVVAAPVAASAAPDAGPRPAAARAAVAAPTTATDDGGTQRFEVVVPAAGAPRTAAAVTGDTLLATDAAAAGRVQTPVVEADTFQTVGVTWPLGADVAGLDPQVRVRADGVWSPWQALEVEDAVATPGSADAAHQRGGTFPVWVGDADAAQLSFAARATAGPDGMRLVLIDAGDAPTGVDVSGTRLAGTLTPAADAGTTAARTTRLQAAAPTPPTVISREQWGARPAACASDVANALVGATVHHTAGSNSYTTVAQAMEQIRGDQRYHIEDQGWCDIGYNFLVDKWGNIYEGRDDSLTRPIIGAHTAGANTGLVGVAMIGTYTSVTPSAATQDAVARLLGWRLGAYHLDPTGTRTYVASAGSKFPVGSTQTLPVVAGHRDYVATECPGNAGYPVLPALRTTAATVAAQPGIPTDNPFSDVTHVNPFFDDIVWLKGSGVTTGYPDGSFAPAGSVTREAMAAFLYRFTTGTPDLPTCTGTSRRFVDVTAGNPFCGAIEALADDGILHGWTDGTFRPSEAVTRQAMAAFLYRFATGTSDVPSCTGDSRRFTDVPVGDPFCGAVEWLATTGVTTGWPDGTFRPGAQITREAMAAFLHRLDGYLA